MCWHRCPAFVILLLVAAAIRSAGADSDVIPPGYTAPIEPKKTAGIVEEEPDVCEYAPTVAEALSGAVFNQDINCAGDVLSESSDIRGLAKGLRFDPAKRGEVLEKSTDRNKDPDVVAMKAIAKSALDTKAAAKLAAVMVISTLDIRDKPLETALLEDLSDAKLMLAVLNADANEEFVPDVQSLSTGKRRAILSGATRRLACDGCTPASSLVCAHCWASDVCESFFWCSKKE